MPKNKQKRSIAKTITWRITATLTTMILVFIFTGSLELAAGIGSIEAVAKMILYYVHERGWEHVKWGK